MKNKFILQIPGMLLFPPRCPVCDRVLEQDVLFLMRDMMGERLPGHNPWFCPKCRGKIKPVAEPYCVKCGKPITSAHEEYCADCLRRAHVFTQNRALWEYNGEVRRMLWRLKYENRSDFAQAIGWEMARKFGGWMERKRIEAVVPVPLHKRKKRLRGFNQAQAIAAALAARTGVPLEAKLLYRCRYTPPQKNLTARERKNNLKNAFQLAKDIVKLKKVLLIDDIYTTGSTLDAAADALAGGGVSEVYCICVGIGRSS